MTNEEAERDGWGIGRHGPPPVIVLDDGTLLYPSRDPEGNGPGALFGASPDGGLFMVSGDEHEEPHE